MTKQEIHKNIYTQKAVKQNEIELHEISVRDVTKGYIDSAENGVVGYDRKLNIRPAFQREFIYKDKQRDEVIRTLKKFR
ncbi:hypothetical protein [Hominenteromicrobium sp.]|uniref:hypothetical protein n=1 Tax=Hominenteromicrobium sp. TaxID=3073581 RepID=UPI0039946671